MKIEERKRSSHTQRWLLPYSWRPLLALSMALLALLGMAAIQAPRAHAAGTGPIIHWDQTMIYPGQNNGNPEGPVGEPTLVHGEGFTAGQQLKLLVVPGDSNADATVCKADSNSTTVASHVTVDSSGTFSQEFSWPAVVGQNKTYSICGFASADNSVVSTRDDGPFTVLSTSAPTFSISANSVAAGSTITVSGQNWVPPQPLNIAIASCADCDPGNMTIPPVTANSTSNGSFSVTVPIPASATVGSYVVNVSSQNGPLDAFHLPVGVQKLTVTAPVATPTPEVTPSPAASATAVSTTTPTATSTTGNTNDNSSSGGSGLLIVVIVAIVILLMAIGGIIFYMVAQRKKLAQNEHMSASPSFGSPATPIPGGSPYNHYNAQGGPMTPFPSGPAMNQQGQFNPSSNGGSPGYNGQQPWQGNHLQQGQAFQPQQFAPASRVCVRCGSQLAPNSPICGRCGMNNSGMSDPNSPTIAY